MLCDTTKTVVKVYRKTINVERLIYRWKLKNVHIWECGQVSSLVFWYEKLLKLKWFNFIPISYKDDEYLIEWQGWPLGSRTWEPSYHLTLELVRLVFLSEIHLLKIWILPVRLKWITKINFRSYENPRRPSEARLHEAGRQFYCAILASLKSKSLSPSYVPMELDLWRYAIKGKGWTRITKDLNYIEGMIWVYLSLSQTIGGNAWMGMARGKQWSPL